MYMSIYEGGGHDTFLINLVAPKGRSYYLYNQGNQASRKLSRLSMIIISF